MAAYLFSAKDILRIQICFNTTNPASRRIAEKAGFTYEGVMRHAYRFDDKPVDMKCGRWCAPNARRCTRWPSAIKQSNKVS
jgi:RimJ/RimL family protein N-acetyltransferase